LTVAGTIANTTQGEEYDLSRLQTIPYNEEEEQKIQKVHNEFSGHRGVESTCERLKELGHDWEHMREHVKYFIKKCPLCQKMTYLKPPIQVLRYVNSTLLPQEKLQVDSIGPLPPDEEGNCHIIVVVDTFTRFVELYPTKDTTAKSAAKALLQHSGRYGVASTITTDNGPQYANEAIKELGLLIGTQHNFTLTYSKEENGIVERMNKEVMRHLKMFIYSRNIVVKWSEYLPLVQRIINASVNKRIGVAPAQLLFGNALNLDRGIIDTRSAKIPSSVSDWTAGMLQAQKDLIHLAQTMQLTQHKEHLADNDMGEITHYPANSFVLVSYPQGAFKRSEPTKFHSHWKGPMQVLSNVGARYQLLNLANGKTEEHHVSRIKKYIYDGKGPTPGAIALKDNQHYLIEAILAHRGNPKQRNRMTFKVRWVGYNHDEDTTWEPWSNLKDNAVLHQYLGQKNMESLIPPRYRTGTSNRDYTLSQRTGHEK